jgi:mannose-6-phosphate isomerase-like protein (cupin superfamily)
VRTAPNFALRANKPERDASQREDIGMDIQARLFAHDAGNASQIGRMKFYSKMTADDTQGAYTVVEALVPPDSGSGLHRHWSYDEAALVIDGRFECYVDGKQIALRGGESVYWPRGAVHKFRSIGPGDGHILFICSPGKIFEDFIEQVSVSKVDGAMRFRDPPSTSEALQRNTELNSWIERAFNRVQRAN